MPLFEIPSADNHHADVIFVRYQNNPDDPVYTHYAFTRGITANPNEIRQLRGIPFNNFRVWEWFCQEFPNVEGKCIRSIIRGRIPEQKGFCVI